MEIADINYVSGTIDVDKKNRIYVLTATRQLKDSEMEIGRDIPTMENGEIVLKNIKIGERKTSINDMSTIHIFTPEGLFLGESPINRPVNFLRIFGNRMFFIDYFNMIVYEYRIVDLE